MTPVLVASEGPPSDGPPSGCRQGASRTGAQGPWREGGLETAPLRILLVEDNSGDAELVRYALEATRSEVTIDHVERVADAVGRARSGDCQIALLDLSLPDSVGLEGTRRLRAAVPGLPIIVLTALDDDRLAAQAVAEGAQDYLVKGQITGTLLLRSMRYAIERQQYAERTRQLAEERLARIAAEVALSALRESEETARRRAAELQAVLDAVPAAVFITRDREARSMAANRYCADLLRIPATTNVSKTASQGFPPLDIHVLHNGVEIPPGEMPVQLAASRGEEVRDYEFDANPTLATIAALAYALGAEVTLETVRALMRLHERAQRASFRRGRTRRRRVLASAR